MTPPGKEGSFKWKEFYLQNEAPRRFSGHQDRCRPAQEQVAAAWPTSRS